MKKMSPKILFFGNERLATGVTTTAPVLQALIAADYEIAAVVVSQNDLGKSRRARPLEIVELAEANNIQVISPENLGSAKDELAVYGAEVGVLVAYGKIVPQDVIDIFPRGIINIHPSLLPKHRGSTPIESVILQGEAGTGVSLMSLAEQMDAGPVYAQQAVSLTGRETKQELVDKLSIVGRNLMIQNLPAILDGLLEPKPQNEDYVTTDKQISKQNGEIDWGKPAEQVEREIRAYAGWPRSRTKLAKAEIVITKAHVINGRAAPGTLWLEGQQFGMHTKEGVLVIDSLIPAGKPEMPAVAFLAGYKLT